MYPLVVIGGLAVAAVGLFMDGPKKKAAALPAHGPVPAPEPVPPTRPSPTDPLPAPPPA